MIEAIVEARRARRRKSGEAQHATQQRRALRTWVSDFRTVARVALRQEPQLLEVLGTGVAA